MIKPNIVPFGLIVAAVAFRTEVIGVDILQSMAGHASLGEILIDLAGMTSRATDLLVSAPQLKFGFAVVERLYLLPICLTVAAVAFLTETTLVRINLLVAVKTKACGLSKSHFWQMTGVALNVPVGTLKRKI